MFTRIGVVALNTYREAVRARVLHGLFGLALVTAGYCLVVGQFALHSALRVISDLGAATVSFFGIVVAVVLGATSLYRELELKTVFPILARPIHRAEYLVGKYLGTRLHAARVHRGECGRAPPVARHRREREMGGVDRGARREHRRRWNRRLAIGGASHVRSDSVGALAGGRGLVSVAGRRGRSPRGARSGRADPGGGGHRGSHRDRVFVVLVTVSHGDVHVRRVHRRAFGGHAGALARPLFRSDHSRHRRVALEDRAEPHALRPAASLLTGARRAGVESRRVSGARDAAIARVERRAPRPRERRLSSSRFL